ncbi:MAG TPA: multiheme c-type cytochrome, partial [Acidobacteriaceae bacterium]|nr:multiheme c-type cytochrome [Acidobacteriaceae bacterium]
MLNSRIAASAASILRPLCFFFASAALLLAPLPGIHAAGQQAPAQTPQQPATSANDEGTFGAAPGGTEGASTIPSWLTAEPSGYDKHITSKYNYAFGKDEPFLPSNATSYNHQFLSPKSFLTAQYCGHCHQESYHQWRQSAHSNSFRAPWYLKNVNNLIDEKGVQYSRHCEGCHNPVALLSGDLSQGMPRKRPFEDEGVTCTTCHSITSTTTMGTGSWVMGPPAVMVDETGAPITHSVPDSEILAHLDRHSKAVMRPLLHTSEFCAACHKASIPKSLDDYKWLRAIGLYDEWQSASFSKESP